MTEKRQSSAATTVAMDKRHMELVKFVIEHTGNIASTAIATEVGIFPASVYHIFTNSLSKGKVCTKWISICA
jgi:hypothetical protein